jgi:phosphohistidine phosphatase
MMKTLYLLRHADAEPAKYYDDDRDRELSSTGERDARRLGRFLSATDQLPDQFLTSTAVRARQTAEVLPVGGDWQVEVPLRPCHDLYRAQPADVLDEIQATEDEVQAILLVGHEPTWSTTVSQLVGAANVSLPAGTCVRIDVNGDVWSTLSFGDGTLRWMIPPKLLS